VAPPSTGTVDRPDPTLVYQTCGDEAIEFAKCSPEFRAGKRRAPPGSTSGNLGARPGPDVRRPGRPPLPRTAGRRGHRHRP